MTRFANKFNDWLETTYKNNQDRTGLECCVSEIILSYEEPENTLTDVHYYGCESGAISELIYYVDTHKFYDDYYSDIECLRQDYHQTFGEPLIIPQHHDMKNWLAWWAFEFISSEIHAEWDANISNR